MSSKSMIVRFHVRDYRTLIDEIKYPNTVTLLLEVHSSLQITVYSLRPRLPPFLRVESEGTGVTSSMRPIFIPERARALSADWAPGPGVFVLLPPVARSLMCSAVMPRVLHFSATS